MTISTFTNDTKKDDLKDLILNPLIGEHNKAVTDIVTLKSDIAAAESDIVSAVADIAASAVDIADAVSDIAALGANVVTAEADIVKLKTDVTAVGADVVTAEADIVKLKADVANLSGGSTPSNTPTKWYVLPLAGQSNMWGCGEQPYDLETPDPRLMQLAIHSSIDKDDAESKADTFNAGPLITPFGSRYKEFRPMEDSNLQMIPSNPCLDSAHNGFHVGYFSPVSGGKAAKTHKYGNVGFGHYLAKALLPYLPRDYGICIVNASRGGGGIASGSSGTFDSSTLRPSSGANGHGWDQPFNKMLRYRIKHVLDLNPDNKLLPFIWMQGESDPNGGVAHYDSFKNIVSKMKEFLVTNNLESRLPFGSIHNMKWFCLGGTRTSYVKGSVNPSYLGLTSYAEADHTKRARFDNYCYLSSDPDFINPNNRESYISFLRTDVDQSGNFVETVLEENTQNGTENVFSSYTDTHYSNRSLQSVLPGMIVNAIACSNSGYLIGAPRQYWTRTIPGGFGEVHTNNVDYIYPRKFDPGFLQNEGLVLSRDYVNNTVVTDASITVVGEVENVSADSDGVLRAILDGSSSTYMRASFSALSDWTVSLHFKCDPTVRGQTKWLMGTTSSTEGLAIVQMYGQIYLLPSKNATSYPENYCLNPSSVGAWNGLYSDWQHLVVSHDGVLGTTHVYLNGSFIHTISDKRVILMDYLNVGEHKHTESFKGELKSFHLYNRSLSTEEACSLYFMDTSNKYKLKP